MDNIVSFIEPKNPKRVCSFCKRDESEVTSLIASQINNSCICGDCILHAKKRLLEASDASAAAIPAAVS